MNRIFAGLAAHELSNCLLVVIYFTERINLVIGACNDASAHVISLHDPCISSLIN